MCTRRRARRIISRNRSTSVKLPAFRVAIEEHSLSFRVITHTWALPRHPRIIDQGIYWQRERDAAREGNSVGASRGHSPFTRWRHTSGERMPSESRRVSESGVLRCTVDGVRGTLTSIHFHLRLCVRGIVASVLWMYLRALSLSLSVSLCRCIVTYSHREMRLSTRASAINVVRGSVARRRVWREETNGESRGTQSTHTYTKREEERRRRQPAGSEWECGTARVHNATPYRLIQFDSLWHGVHRGYLSAITPNP